MRAQLSRGTVLVAALTIACGGQSGADRQAEEAAKAMDRAAEQIGDTAGSGAERAAKGLEEMAKGFAAMADGDGKTAEPVSFRDLQALFPDIDGWEKGKPTGERMTMPVPFSQAEVTYTRGDATVTAKIVDSTVSSLLLAPYSAFLASGYEREDENGYEKSTTVAGQPGWEKWNGADRSGELNALVAKRFIVQFEGSNLADVSVLRQMIERLDTSKLASLK
jgi:hypothetical protein